MKYRQLLAAGIVTTPLPLMAPATAGDVPLPITVVDAACAGLARSRWSSNPSRSICTDVGGHGLANLRLGFRSGDTWDVCGWVRNAFDRKYFQELNAATGGNTGLIVGIPGDPRTWGLTLRASF